MGIVMVVFFGLSVSAAFVPGMPLVTAVTLGFASGRGFRRGAAALSRRSTHGRWCAHCWGAAAQRALLRRPRVRALPARAALRAAAALTSSTVGQRGCMRMTKLSPPDARGVEAVRANGAVPACWARSRKRPMRLPWAGTGGKARAMGPTAFRASPCNRMLAEPAGVSRPRPAKPCWSPRLGEAPAMLTQ